MAPLPERGLLGMWFDRKFWKGRPPLVCRWFPDPDEKHAVDAPPDSPPLAWLYETALRYRPTEWLGELDDAALRAIIGDVDLVNVYEQLHAVGRESPDASQEILPASWDGLAGNLGTTGLQGRTVLYLIEYENEAGFAWGTNSFYLHIDDHDLARGALERVVSAVANW